MDASRKASREDNETTLQYQSRQETLLVEELNEDKLTQLLESVSQLEQTPPGAAELQRRTKLFGECKRIEGETSGAVLRSAAPLVGQGHAADEIASPCSEADWRLVHSTDYWSRGVNAGHFCASSLRSNGAFLAAGVGHLKGRVVVAARSPSFHDGSLLRLPLIATPILTTPLFQCRSS